MICPESIDSTPVESPKSFLNWARSISFRANTAYRPSTRGEIVEIVRQAEEGSQRVKWTGSLWSFTESFVSNDIVVETDAVSGVIGNDVILDRLSLTDDGQELLGEGLLVHVKGGTNVFNVNRVLHGLPPAANGGGADENNLNCSDESKAMLTLGGSGGQSIAGLVATGSHGGDVSLPPIADTILAIHLIGPGGQEWWIERSSGLTAGSESDTQAEIQSIASTVPEAAEEICEHTRVKKDDDFFNSVLVSVGRMGFTYSFVILTTNAFKLQETRTSENWERFRSNLSAASFNDFIGRTGPRFLNILINPFRTRDGHECKVTVRERVDCSVANDGMEDDESFDFMTFFCRMQDVRRLLAILVPTLAVLIALSVGLAATATALATIPFVGWILAAAVYVVLAATLAIIAVLTTLIAFLTVSGSLSSGELIATIMNFAYTVGLKDVMSSLLTSIFDGAYPLDSKTGVSWKIMDTYGYSGEDFCQKVDSMEFAFDVHDVESGGYLQFIQSVLDIFEDLHNRNIAVAGLLALRYTTITSALIGMSKFPTTCHIEIPILKNFQGNAEFLERVQRSAIALGGVPHWGQLMNVYDGFDIRDLHGDDLITWRQTLTELIRSGGGEEFTFSNDFTVRYFLEPWEDVEIESITLEVSVGGDPLGDTDWLRHDVSADFAFARLRGGGLVEISLNEGTTWNAWSVHLRTMDMPAGTTWGDVEAVGIRHVAAGNDWNADNWTMQDIVIRTTDTAGVVRERYNHPAPPAWYFQKNSNQVWDESF